MEHLLFRAVAGAVLLVTGSAQFVTTTRAEDIQTAPPKKVAGNHPVDLFNGKDLTGWKIADENGFERHGNVRVDNGELVLDRGQPATGVVFQGQHPRLSYELKLEAKRVAGGDFFCGLTFPVDKEYCTLIVGGWGGGVTGLSNIDGQSAVDNETTGYTDFKLDCWYKIRLRVTEQRIQTWVDNEQIVDVKKTNRRFDIWWEQEPMRPLGIASWQTKAALRNILLTDLSAEPETQAEADE